MGNPRIDKVVTRRRIEDALRKLADENTLADIARKIGVKIAYLPEPNVCPPCGLDRPDFGPKQVRFLCQLQVGKRYGEIDACFHGKVIPFVVLEKPRYNLDCKGWLVRIKRDGEREGALMSLQDHNIFPYHPGHWGREHIVFLDGEDYSFSRRYVTGCCWCPYPDLQHS